MIEPSYIPANLPSGRSGEWLLEHFEIDDEADAPPDHEILDCARLRAGRYTRLKRGDTVFMTDLYDEWFTQKIAIEQARRRGGEILITGLGLGLIVESILQGPGSAVEKITVIERSKDVYHLVAPHLSHRYPHRLEILLGDAFSWQPPAGERYRVVWHDIWPNPQDSTVEAEIDRLEQRYQGYCDWQGSWPREYRWIYEGLPWRREG